MKIDKNTAGDVIDLADFDALDTSEMEVQLNGKLTGWKWTFAGPGHEKTVAWQDKADRERLQKERKRETAINNGRKWKAEEQTPDELKEKNVAWILARLLGWSPVRMNGEDFAFTPENAKKVLLDPRKPILLQAVEFLLDEQSFTPRSATSL